LRLVVAYDGTDFHGFASQPGVATVAGVLQEALEAVVGHPVVLGCAGRTDTGVHAWGQVVGVTVAPAALERGGDRLLAGINAGLPPTVVVREVSLAPEGFDARFSAVARSYRYTVVTAPTPDPFRRRVAWHVPGGIDLRAANLACDPLIGEHDFSAFCRAAQRPDGTPATLVRRVYEARWVALDATTVQFRIRASSFCHQMVRSVVGTLVEVGRGRRKAGEMMGVLASGDRQQAGQLAPPTGLCLWSVEYPSLPGGAVLAPPGGASP